MAGGSNSSIALTIAERRSQAVKLRVAGLSYREIAEHLEVSPGTIHADVSSALLEIQQQTRRDVEELRTLEYQRLEEIWRRLFEQFSKGGQRPELVVALHRNSELRSRLLGLEATKQTAIQSGVNREVEVFTQAIAAYLPCDAYEHLMKAITMIAAENDVIEVPANEAE